MLRPGRRAWEVGQRRRQWRRRIGAVRATAAAAPDGGWDEGGEAC